MYIDGLTCLGVGFNIARLCKHFWCPVSCWHQQLCASSYFLLSLYLGHCYINPTFLSRFSKITGQIQMIIIYIFSFAITPVSDNDDIMEIYLKLRKTTKNYWPKNTLIYLLQGWNHFDYQTSFLKRLLYSSVPVTL